MWKAFLAHGLHIKGRNHTWPTDHHLQKTAVQTGKKITYRRVQQYTYLYLNTGMLTEVCRLASEQRPANSAPVSESEHKNLGLFATQILLQRDNRDSKIIEPRKDMKTFVILV